MGVADSFNKTPTAKDLLGFGKRMRIKDMIS